MFTRDNKKETASPPQWARTQSPELLLYNYYTHLTQILQEVVMKFSLSDEKMKSLFDQGLELLRSIDKREQDNIKAFNKAVEDGKPLQWITGRENKG